MNKRGISESLHTYINSLWGGHTFERAITTLENTPTPLFEESLRFIAHVWKAVSNSTAGMAIAVLVFEGENMTSLGFQLTRALWNNFSQQFGTSELWWGLLQTFSRLQAYTVATRVLSNSLCDIWALDECANWDRANVGKVHNNDNQC